MGYIRNLAVSISQLGNAISGGNADATVSGRVGYNAIKAPAGQELYWESMEKLIDWAFYPLDGHNHCQQAFRGDTERYRSGSWRSRLVLALLTVPACIVIGPVLRLAKVNPWPGPPTRPTGVVK